MPEWPKFLISVDGYRKFTTMQDAGMSLDSWFCKVDILRSVLEEDLSVRDMTDEEYNQIVRISDDYSASK